MKIFDCHCHIENGLDKYSIVSIQKNIIFNSIESFNSYSSSVSPNDSITLIFDYKNHLTVIKDEIQKKTIRALKIHSRVQQISKKDYPNLIEALEVIMPTIPIIYDAFYFGDNLDFQPSLKSIIKIAKKFPHLPIVIAHCGGYNALKYFYHLRTIENIYYDLSFSLVYLKNTSIFTDIKNLMQFTDKNKILFGTDYPFVDAQAQLNLCLSLCRELSFLETDMEKILFLNSSNLFFGRV
jgi:predicted TIM-barrel fold metal-dependent hydrolase